jgi:GNAT superfamily N-acetyltransferase
LIHRANGLACGPAHDLGVPSEAVIAFYKANWARPIALAVPSFYRWQFLEAPANEGRDLNCVALRGDSELVGVMGLNRRPFWLGGRLVRDGVELTTWVVAEAARGLGVGRGIMTSLQQTYAQMVGLGISHAAMPIYTGSGFRHLWHIPRYFRILDLEKVRPHAKIDAVGERLVSAWTGSAAVKYGAERVVAPVLARCDAVMQQRLNCYTRDAASLGWRYRDHPVYQYQCYLVNGAPGGTGAAVICRADETAGIRFMHVVDCFGDDADMAAAVTFVEERARAQGAAFVDIYCSATAIARHFLAAGWFSTNDDYFFQLSHLFYPPEFRPVQTTSAVLWSREGMSDLLDFGRLYLTKGDLDLDRPTLAYYEAHGIPVESGVTANQR